MKQVTLICCLFAIWVFELNGAPTLLQPHNGSTTPKLTLVAMVDGKGFFLDRILTGRNRTEALEFCATLGMRLAEITSASQFSVLDQAVVEEWAGGSATWIGGVQAKGIQRYVWESSNETVTPSYIPYQERLGEDYMQGLHFTKNVNNSFISNSLATERWTSTLCETLPNNQQNLLEYSEARKNSI